jgi:hypothetical protein
MTAGAGLQPIRWPTCLILSHHALPITTPSRKLLHLKLPQSSKTICPRVRAKLGVHIGEVLKSDKVRIAGPPVALPALAAQTLSLAIHEPTTNAIKHGALAQPTGKLVVTWKLEAYPSCGLLALH